MKVIVTGATGLIGGGCLRQALLHPKITEVVVLSRRPLPSNELTDNNPKLRVVILKDFLTYDEQTLGQLDGAVGCLWGLGNLAQRNVSNEEKIKVSVEYPLALVRAILPRLKTGVKFRMSYIGGMITVMDEKAKLWFLGDLRKKGAEGQRQLYAFQQSHPDQFQVTVANCGFARPVPPKDWTLLYCRLFKQIQVDDLGSAMAQTALEDCDQTLLWPYDLVERGRRYKLANYPQTPQ